MLLLPKSVQQVAALPFVFLGEEPNVLLVTSRERRRWIVPKGWPIKGQSAPKTAAQEAAEEAGVYGIVADEPIGYYDYKKHMSAGYEVPASVAVFPMLVLEQRLDWTERTQRKQRWCSLTKAAERVDDRDLGKLILSLTENGYGAFAALAQGILDGVAQSLPR